MKNISCNGSRIHYARWVPVHVEFFKTMLARMANPRTAALYLTLLERAHWRKNGCLQATIAEIARWIGLHKSTVSHSIRRLETLGYVERLSPGVPHSRSNKPVWRIRHARFELSNEQWVPVPTFFFRNYLKAYPKSVLVALLLYYQHLRWLKFSWAEVPTLSTRTGWSRASVYKAIQEMGRKHKWEKLQTGLPFPVQIEWSNGTTGRRQFAVRFANYDPKRKHVYLNDEFAKRFSGKSASAGETTAPKADEAS